MWKAKQQESAAGYISNIGCLRIDIAISPRTGRITLAMATFDVNSVRVWQTKQIRNSKAKNGNFSKTLRDAPNIFDMPEAFPPSARAKPPPSKNTSDLLRNFRQIHFNC